jgi:hypothetical protein
VSLDEDDALDTLDRAEPGSSIYDPKERRTLMKLLWAYSEADDVNEFAERLQLPVTKELETLFEKVHHAYLAAWNRYGGGVLWGMARTGWDYLYDDDWRLV